MRNSKLEAEIISTLNGCFTFEEILEAPTNVWLQYAKRIKIKKKYYSYRKRERYPRDEPTYNKCQENEFQKFLEYLEPAVNYVLDRYLPENSSYEYYTKLHDNLICLCVKVYFGKSLRRSMGLIHYIVTKEWPDIVIPCFKTLNNYQNKSVITFYIDKIIEATSEPLNRLETRFATDGTGEATFRYSTWYSIKVGKRCRRRDHKIAQVTSTVRLNAAVAVDVLNHEDPNLMQKHVKLTGNSFSIEHWSGDSYYLTRDNCNAIKENGGKAHIRIKSNTITNARGSMEWKRTVTLQKQKDTVELDELNLRQNAEATNSAKKRKFGSYTLSMNDRSQINDIKISWLCYNYSVLSRANYEYDIVPAFVTHKFSRIFFRLGSYT